MTKSQSDRDLVFRDWDSFWDCLSMLGIPLGRFGLFWAVARLFIQIMMFVDGFMMFLAPLFASGLGF